MEHPEMQDWRGSLEVARIAPKTGMVPLKSSTLLAAEAELRDLKRWKSTNAPRLAALEVLLHAAQLDANAGREAATTLASERAANALLTDEVERLRAALAQSCDEHRAQVYESGPGGGCPLLAERVAAERERWKRIADAAQAVTDKAEDIGDFIVSSSLMAALALALDEGPNVRANPAAEGSPASKASVG